MATSMTPELLETPDRVDEEVMSLTAASEMRDLGLSHHEMKVSTSACTAVNAFSVASKLFLAVACAISSLCALTASTALSHARVANSIPRVFHACMNPRTRRVVAVDRALRDAQDVLVAIV